jgi:N4-gp56 family major capsid protein
MAQFTWSFDAPSGTYKQHALSRKLYYAALEKSKFMDHVRPVDGFGKKMGENVTLTRVRTIAEPSSANLTEGVRIPEDQFRLSTVSITVVEIGRAVPFTSFAQDLSFFDVQNAIQKRLMQQMRLVLDTKAAAAFKTAKLKYAPQGAASYNLATTGSPAAATSNLNVYHVEEIRDAMWDTYLVPGIDGDDNYVGIFRTLGIRGLKRDPDWDQWHVYTNPQAKYNGEVGKIEGVRFITTNHANALGKKASNVLGEGVVFGEDAVAMAEVLTPELRGQTNVGHDFGRANAVAWYGILEFGLIWDTANAGEARIVHVTSS